MSETLQLSRSVYASAAHRYWNLAWSPERNRAVYGADASAEGLGSNFRIEVCATDAHEEDLLAPLAILKSQVDHQCLFSEQATSLEFIAQSLKARLFSLPLRQGRWRSCTLWESEALACTLFSDDRCELRVRLANLEIRLHGPVDPESRLGLRRADIPAAVTQFQAQWAVPDEPAKWSQRVYSDLNRVLKNLHSVRIDLKSHEYLLVGPPSTS